MGTHDYKPDSNIHILHDVAYYNLFTSLAEFKAQQTLYISYIKYPTCEGIYHYGEAVA